jgi:hypothetical protein
MIRVTLDNNVIIDIENKNHVADYERLLQLHAERKIVLRIPAISASERKPDGTYNSNFNEFKRRICAAGLSDAEILKPIAYFGISYWDYCLFGGGDLSVLDASIQKILFPKIETEFAGYCKNRGIDEGNADAWRKWVNAKCDVLSIWCHIYHNGDIFATRDRNFHKVTKKPQLIRLGAKEILKPREVLAQL